MAYGNVKSEIRKKLKSGIRGNSTEWLEILVKELVKWRQFTRPFVDFPGCKMEGSGDGCIAYLLRFWRFDKLVKLQPVPISCSHDMALEKVKVHLLYFETKPVVYRHGYRQFACRAKLCKSCPDKQDTHNHGLG